MTVEIEYERPDGTIHTIVRDGVTRKPDWLIAYNEDGTTEKTTIPASRVVIIHE